MHGGVSSREHAFVVMALMGEKMRGGRRKKGRSTIQGDEEHEITARGV